MTAERDPDQIRIEHHLVRAHGLAAIGSLVLVGIFGFLVALKLVVPGLLSEHAWSTWGRLRYAHTQGIFFGWLGNAFLAFLYYVIPRLTDRPVTSRALGWVMFVVWQLGILIPGWALVLAGHNQPLEWAEFPIVIDVIVLIAFALAVVQFVGPFLKTRASELYVSGWYILAGLVFTPLAYAVGNFVPEHLAGPMGAAFSGLWTHDAVGLFVTPMALAVAYYVIPATTRRPIFSHALSLIGFWLLVFIYPLNGMHHYLMSPLPMDEQRGTVVASLLLGANVIIVVFNLMMSMRPSARIANTVASRFVWAGVVFYLLVSLQGALQSLMPFNRVIHFTDWVIGHSHLAMLGFGSFCAIGALVHVWKHSPLARYNERLLRAAYWLLASGLIAMVVDLSIVGLLQAQSWFGDRPWIESVVLSAPFWTIRVVSGALLIVGFITLVVGMTTGSTPADRLGVKGVTRDFTIETRRGERVVPRVIGWTYIIIFLVGGVFFALSFVVLGVEPAIELSHEIEKTTPPQLSGPTAAEQRGRLVFAREGCAFCHTQQIRTTEEDVRRFGPATAAWETRNDVPHMLGTRRIGPDLSREAALRPNDWHLMHLFEPNDVEPSSVMPPFPWLYDGSPARPTDEALDLVAYLQSLGRERLQAGTVPSAPHCNCKAVDTSAPSFRISNAAGDIERGARVFHDRCSGCHGPRGHGDGPGSAILYPQPANLTAASFSAERLSSVVWNGVPGTAMPKFRELSKEDLKSVIAFVASLGPEPIRPHGDLDLGRLVFEDRCINCHGANGRGDGPSEMLNARLPANFHEKQPSTARAIDVLLNGVLGTAMVRMDQNMSPAQRDAVAAYVQSFFDQQPPEASPR